jgi:arginine-tRNA-protein transferase
MTINQKKPDLYLSMPHPCSYLPERVSTIVFVDPRHTLNQLSYAHYVRQGFRRSGDLVYRPYCQACSACVPVRIPVARFTPGRGQRRALKRNQDVAVVARPPVMDAEHFALYRRYQAGRHAGSSMDDPDPERYANFLLSKQADTRFYEFRIADDAERDPGRLLAVAVSDLLPDGLSAVYTFYDPDLPARGLGTYAILWQVAEARRLGLPWVYLGYWIKDSPKMAYKTNFHPVEIIRNGRWVTLDRP